MAPQKAEYRATSEFHVRGRRDDLLATTEWQSGARESHAFCTILGDEDTVLHLVRFGWQAGGPKTGEAEGV